MLMRILRCAFGFETLHGAADGHAADVEVLADRLHAVSTASVRLGHSPISTAVVRYIIVEGLLDGPALTLRYLSERARGIDQGLHAFDEPLGAQVDLILEIEPGTRCVRAFGDKPPVFGCCPLVAVGKYAQQPVGFEKRRSLLFPRRRAIAAPWPLLRPGYHARAHRVEDQVARKLEKVTVLIDQDTLEASLKEVADTAMGTVDVLGVDTVELSHALGQIGVGRFDQQMIMIRHQAIGMTDPVETFAGSAQDVQKRDAVVVSSALPRKVSRRSFPRAVMWYSAPENSSRKGLAMSP